MAYAYTTNMFLFEQSKAMKVAPTIAFNAVYLASKYPEFAKKLKKGNRFRKDLEEACHEWLQDRGKFFHH